MKKFDISTDSNCDLYADEIKDLDIYVGHLCYTLDDGNDIVEYLDKYTKYEEYVDFYNKLRSGIVSKTSILSVQAHVEVFTEMAEKGIREVLHIAQSYGLSPTLDNANKAIEIVKEKYPDMHIVAIESSTTTVGEGLLVRLACDMRDKGKTLEETKEYIENNKNKLQHIIMVGDLNFLKRGGRISGASAMIGTMLNIKPVIEFTKEGRLEVVRKEMGLKKALNSAVNEFMTHTLNKDYPYVVVVHTGNEALAKELHDLIQTKTGIDAEIRIMGPIIGSHIGPDGVAMGFLSNEERPY